MRKIFYVLIILYSIINVSFAQNKSLYVPLNIQNAIKKGTRTYNGLPGKNYWQNYSDYKITAEVIPDSGYLKGNETIVYFNESPDTLKTIVMRIYQDITKKGALRDWYIPAEKLNDGVKLNYIIVNNDTLNVLPGSPDISRGSTNLRIKLKDSLLPESKIKLQIGWEFKIPDQLKIRMGNYGNGNMFIAYWYPQISVYDDIDGWDVLDYEGSVEFYNDFNNYNVTVKLPEGFLMWATGKLTNAKEVLRSDIYKKYKLAQQSDTTIKIITPQDYEKGKVTAPNNFNLWKFTANNVSDFSFAISNNYNWDAASTIVDFSANRRVLTDVVYKDSAYFWNNGAEISKTAIDYYSNEMPGYPYPYPHITSFCNGSRGGGMETPMMTNDGEPKNKASLVGLLSHEIAHSYFPFIMGTNERKYAWMDEGWASFLPREIVDRFDPLRDYWRGRTAAYEHNAGKEAELPPIVPSYSYKGRYARTGFYNRPTNAYRELELLLGRKLFKKALLEYMKRWHGKHPIPYDFFFTFDDVANEDLSWFWKPWFFEFGYPDLAVVNAEQKNGEISVTIKKEGNIPTRVLLTFEYDDGTKEEVRKSCRVWKNGNSTVTITVADKNKKIKRITLGNNHIPDAVKTNNSFVFEKQQTHNNFR